MAEFDVELERYELFEGPRYRFELDRRDFLKGFTTGLVVLLIAPRAGAQQESGRGAGDDRLPADVNAWLHIEDDGKVTAFTGKTEIGQNIRTSLTQAVAEELKVPAAAIALVMADTARTPFAKVNGRDFVTGRHRYTSDIVRDGMLHAKVVRPTAYGATPARIDTSAAERLPGVVVVRDGSFLGVAAPSAEAAADAAAAIKVEWSAGSGASARTLYAGLKSKHDVA